MTLQEGDLVRRVTPVFDPVLNAEIRALQKCKGPLADEEGRLLSGLTRRQHAWYQTPPGRALLCFKAEVLPCLHRT